MTFFGFTNNIPIIEIMTRRKMTLYACWFISKSKFLVLVISIVILMTSFQGFENLLITKQSLITKMTNPIISQNSKKSQTKENIPDEKKRIHTTPISTLSEVKAVLDPVSILHYSSDKPNTVSSLVSNKRTERLIKNKNVSVSIVNSFGDRDENKTTVDQYTNTNISSTDQTRNKSSDSYTLLVGAVPTPKPRPRRRVRLPLSKGLVYPLMMDLRGAVTNYLSYGKNITQTPINPHPFRYIHSPKKCNMKSKSRGILVIVKSTANNFHIRNGIRETWGDLRNIDNIRVVFLLGLMLHHGNKTQYVIDNEAHKYGDIVQENFLDDYFNNTYKTIMGYNWAVDFCSTANFLFFVDDDHLVLVPNLIEHIDNLHPLIATKIFQGRLVPHSRPFTNPGSKWYVSLEEYPHDFYPKYLAGGAYLVSFEIARRMKVAFPYVQFMKIDDSYLGIVARKLGIQVTSFANFAKPRARLTDSRAPAFIASHGFKNPEALYKFWNPLQKLVASKLLRPRKTEQ